ncbi:MAG: hypothetical protein UR53_C0001G0038 [Candidatus Magasanikbacteria bacterium GW2011_GWC2_34_16]|uniref:General secretion pathway protein M n=2 Tax=Candidatus Magasanikiibacteriota TaxID=1752731 RepID=A0A0G0JVN9_9BACT|nr:MAG: hypothetical protein UR53_C0001G0038 [Candidatus Magasanikbacteria bacterium GW2011_GWC2_34_16]KKQ40974.1 MAG: hypothetical protein US58_C0008G0003 [Candidatus Magasanikbacteria bacterium GW2011_GWA2_37_8]
MRLNLEKRTLLIVSAFSLTASLIIFAIILPTVNYINKLNTDTADLRNYLEKKYEKTIRLRTSVEDIQNIKQATTDYPQYIFNTGNELKLITTFENLAQKNKVDQKIENSNLDRITNQRITLNLNINGSYNNILNYLADLENLNYFIIVEQLQMSPLVDRFNPTSTTTVNLHLNLSLYASQ